MVRSTGSVVVTRTPDVAHARLVSGRRVGIGMLAGGVAALCEPRDDALWVGLRWVVLKTKRRIHRARAGDLDPFFFLQEPRTTIT